MSRRAALLRRRLLRGGFGRLVRDVVIRHPDIADFVRETLATHPEFPRIARDSVLLHPFVFGPPERVVLGQDVVLNNALLNTSSGRIEIGDNAFCGHGVSLLTGTHDVTERGAARQRAIPDSGRDIVIGEGAWLASNATVIGPCVVGEHAVVAAGAVVVNDVPAGVAVGGVPARILRNSTNSSEP
jgi:acetyltransferase-like isoleucine patch superfamily enzyme